MRKNPIDFIQNKRGLVLSGLLALSVGTLVYLTDRRPEETYFVVKSLPEWHLLADLPPVFGKAGHVLPDFIHPFAFSLIFAGFFARSPRGALVICLFWFCVNAAFELGQYYKAAATALVPQWFEGFAYLENCENFFLNGVFDPADLLAMFAGAAAAFAMAARVLKTRN